jgi:hypothetical protein
MSGGTDPLLPLQYLHRGRSEPVVPEPGASGEAAARAGAGPAGFRGAGAGLADRCGAVPGPAVTAGSSPLLRSACFLRLADSPIPPAAASLLP